MIKEIANYFWSNLILMILSIVFIEWQVSRLSSKVNKLKRDADNFGDLLETETSKARKQQTILKKAS